MEVGRFRPVCVCQSNVRCSGSALSEKAHGPARQCRFSELLGLYRPWMVLLSQIGLPLTQSDWSKESIGTVLRLHLRAPSGCIRTRV